MAEKREFCERLGYTFADRSLLDQALTHPSLGLPFSNQRLEFLGDAVLQLCVSQWLYEQYPQLQEGELSRMRAAIVREETLAQAARTLTLGEEVRLGRGEQTDGGRDRPGMLSDTYEAIVAAIYLDGGLSAAQAFVLRTLKVALQAPNNAVRDYKTELQEWLQKRTHTTPEYVLIGEEGPPHDRLFMAECRIEGWQRTRGEGKSKKAAEQQAARRALEEVQACAAEKADHTGI